MKNSHHCDDFFRTVIEALIVALAMQTAGCSKIESFRNWVSESNWLKLIEDWEDRDLGIRRVHLLRTNASSKTSDALRLALERNVSMPTTLCLRPIGLKDETSS